MMKIKKGANEASKERIRKAGMRMTGGTERGTCDGDVMERIGRKLVVAWLCFAIHL